MNQEQEWYEISSGVGDMWNFEEQNIIEGIMQDKRDKVGPNNSWIYEIEMIDGKTFGVWGSTALDGKMKKVSVGDLVKIMYIGKVQSPKTKRTYKDFQVWIKKMMTPQGTQEELVEPINVDQM